MEHIHRRQQMGQGRVWAWVRGRRKCCRLVLAEFYWHPLLCLLPCQREQTLTQPGLFATSWQGRSHSHGGTTWQNKKKTPTTDKGKQLLHSGQLITLHVSLYFLGSIYKIVGWLSKRLTHTVWRYKTTHNPPNVHTCMHLRSSPCMWNPKQFKHHQALPLLRLSLSLCLNSLHSLHSAPPLLSIPSSSFFFPFPCPPPLCVSNHPNINTCIPTAYRNVLTI